MTVIKMNGSYEFSSGPTTSMMIAYGYGNGPDSGVPLMDSPRVAFTHEFLCAPSDKWEVEFRPPEGCKARPVECVLRECVPACLKGTIVRSLAHQRVWVLTGEYDVMGNGYWAVWPD